MATGHEDPPIARTAEGQRLRVLCLEDNEADAELERLYLARAGYDVELQRVDTEAAFAAALADGPFDIIFLDFTLPGWDSPSALRMACEIRPMTPVICVAGTIGEETAVDMLRRGAADYVLKDRMARLPSAVGHALESAGERRARDAAEERLRASEEQYRRIVETANDGILVLNTDLRVVFHNQRFVAMFGFTADDLTDFTPEQWGLIDAPGFITDQTDERRLGSAAQYERCVRRKDGTSMWARISSSPIMNENGGFGGLLAMVGDITAQKEAEGRLRKAVDGTVSAMGGLVEIRDPYTAGHERRVAELAAAIAGEMGLGQGAAAALRLIGQVHDIGKIAVPAEILTRPSRLSEIEFTLIKSHPSVAAEILAPIDFGLPVAEVILQHHERLDGSGYPAGLSGDDILLEARILAVADTVEAMSSHRPYRPALGIEAALEEVRGGAGTLYDADVVAACVRVFARNDFSFGD